MQILYCRIGWMNSYRGASDERPQGGGEYNKENIGHEVHNYLGCEGKYYGFVEAGIKNSIHVERLCGDKKADSVDGILIVWVARKPSVGQVVVGWYENATVYRILQTVPDDVMSERSLKTHNFYNIFSEHAYLIEPKDRHFQIDMKGHSNIWYGDQGKIDSKVVDYIQNYGKEYESRIEKLEKDTKNLVGEEKEAVVKVRINQDKFRSGLLMKYHNKCCLCGVDEESVLNASHIKPWSDSDEHEKLDLGNGLLLCPNHDKLFDRGFISFDENGKIMISDRLSEASQMYMNVTGKMSIQITEDNKEYIRYHREHIFRG